MENTPELADLIDLIQAEEHTVEEVLPGVLHVKGRFSNPERIALRAAADAGDRPIAVWATSHREDWTLIAWDRPDLVHVNQRGQTPQRWRHRELPPTLSPDAQTFLEGASSSFDIETRPKHQPTTSARAVLSRFGITEPAPPGWVPPVIEVPAVVEKLVPVKAPRAPRATKAAVPRTPAKPAKSDVVFKICPTCFMALPSTGVCDNGC
ncbi:hypothetical protein [Nocardioides sp. WS12]|uniref:hypothetical protein n=1 Tax=Nocardioides sp. WS12 TaxID=2486272 RepID=UPI0015FE646D|nr:hypothetical protein [Nocardioides sp. WS12]